MTISLSGCDLDFLRTPEAAKKLRDRATKKYERKLDQAKQIQDKRSDLAMPSIVHDRVEYKSTIDGTMITSRDQHREHIRKHGVVELGNEKIDQATSRANRNRKLQLSLQDDIKQACNELEAGTAAPVLEKKTSYNIPQNIKNGDIVRTTDELE